ncbi:DNA mismatch repair protein MutS [Dyadobacter chenwenxiniae]|uniref:DNA mismatch repair protein MutS n=1 Tax=Dyadobacter chenwenxiniae TaxID=2906456 RepID=A0A9X1TER2_9BACT|nr:DNA mismatch repair protein MutS [Dyadobacter chenwenxiniae]MCF0061899.1 DNA mismatch repair protein MutS [Dyadobacter chenwenxiniae]UON81714.1 DNA mismatch repair protein MutS [Dyadobacter chenwenxiniae]
METSSKAHRSSQEFFETEKNKAGIAEAAALQNFNQLAIARLLVFFAMIFFLWLWNHQNQPVWGLVAFGLLVIFLISMRRQQAARKLRDFQRNLGIINTDELNRLSFRFTRNDSGFQFQEKDHAYGSDLDIFGDYSLYKLLNRTRTGEGSRRLANWLKNHADVKEIKLRQDAAADFSQHPEMIQSLEATALLHEHAAEQLGDFRKWSTEFMNKDLARLLPFRWISILTVVVAVLFLFSILPAWPLLLCIAVNAVLIARFKAYIESVANRTAALGKTLVSYGEILEIAQSFPYQAQWWLDRKARIEGSGNALKQAGVLFERLDYRNNIFFSLLVGIPTLWDIHCLAGLESWKQNYHDRLADWLDVLADVEAMNSLGGHAFANPDYIAPNVTSSPAFEIDTIAMGHPLIPLDRRISNDFSVAGTGHTILVTGSNMSGKSTFLRTIGLNFVLAQMGAVVSAKTFKCSTVRVFSSMRTQDSLEESTSSFYAELKRLRKLLELADEQGAPPVFYLLDEILKGTNSSDRHRGAEALIRQLHTKQASGLVSTHDLELGEWGATENYVHNFHFRSDVENGELLFDYKLHDGICKSFNASELMRMMGINIDK